MGVRYIRGETNPVFVTVATAKAVAIGDMVGMSGGTLVKSSDTTWDTNLATTQTAFGTVYLGVAVQRKDANVARVHGNSEDNRIRVATRGIFEFDTASASYAVGDLVGPAKQTGNYIEDQKVAAVASEAYAIGRVVEATSSSTKVLVELLSNILPAAQQG